MQLNPHYAELNESYLFSTIAHKVADYQKAHPEADVIRLGIGDVTLPLAASVTEAMHKAVEEQGHKGTFHGYIPSEQGYEFLRDAIRRYYAGHGVELDMSEIFISDGAKSDLGNLLDLFSRDNTILVPDPVYPVYVDSNVMAGRAGDFADGRWNRIVYLPCTKENGFMPELPKEHADIVYLCFPNNPTGATITRKALEAWVAWAKREGSLILYDAAYEAFIEEEDVPHSIYEIEGARDVAVEFRSFSKTAGFTGLRCGFVVVPSTLTVSDGNGGRVALKPEWSRRVATKYNGCPYIVQRAAEAVYSDEGQKEIRAAIAVYKKNARLMTEKLESYGLKVYGGKNAPLGKGPRRVRFLGLLPPAPREGLHHLHAWGRFRRGGRGLRPDDRVRVPGGHGRGA